MTEEAIKFFADTCATADPAKSDLPLVVDSLYLLIEFGAGTPTTRGGVY